MTLYTEGLTLARAADDRIAVARLLLGRTDNDKEDEAKCISHEVTLATFHLFVW